MGGIRALEEKVLSLARLVSCTQQFAEAQVGAAPPPCLLGTLCSTGGPKARDLLRPAWLLAWAA